MEIAEKGRRTIGIRRENKTVWERRVALTPGNVKELLQRNPNLKIVVQPSKVRIFNIKEYEQVGAHISEDLSECDLIVGVKEVGVEYLIPNKTYIFFSHVIKGQPANMPMLDALLERKIRLIDYEKIVDEKGQRLIAFGVYAGIAGAFDFFAGFGNYLLKKQISTPFLNMDYPHKYENLEHANIALKKVTDKIMKDGLPDNITPLIFAITGKGRCAVGVQQVLDILPIKVVDAEEIEKIYLDKTNPMHSKTIYVTYILQQHMVQNQDPNAVFIKEEYYDHPARFVPIFHEKYLPYISVIFNCMYWDQKFPRLIDDAQIKDLALSNKSRLLGVCDITCDLEGSIQFLKKFTSPDAPFYMYNAVDGKIVDGIYDMPNGVLYQAYDFLPSELAWDASSYFGKILTNYVENIVYSDINKPLNQQGLLPELERAVITLNGELTPKFIYISKLRTAEEEINQMKGYAPKKVKNALQKSSSFCALRLIGHLFRTKALNKFLNVLNTYQLAFNCLDWRVGADATEESSVFLQIFGTDAETFSDIYSQINLIANEHNIKIQHTE